jgi:hypothetical protein
LFTPKALANSSLLTPKAFALKAFAKRASFTPKAFANFSPGLERSDNPGIAIKKKKITLKGFGNRRALSGFQVFANNNPY